MAGTITTDRGELSFVSVVMNGGQPGTQLLNISRPGLDGVRWIGIGSRAAPAEVVTIVDAVSAAGTLALETEYYLNIGLLASILNDDGNPYNNFMILDMLPLPTQAILGAVGMLNADPRYLLVCRWILQYPLGV